MINLIELTDQAVIVHTHFKGFCIKQISRVVSKIFKCWWEGFVTPDTYT